MPEKPERSLEAFPPLPHAIGVPLVKTEPSDFERSLGSFSLYLLWWKQRKVARLFSVSGRKRRQQPEGSPLEEDATKPRKRGAASARGAARNYGD